MLKCPPLSWGATDKDGGLAKKEMEGKVEQIHWPKRWPRRLGHQWEGKWPTAAFLSSLADKRGSSVNSQEDRESPGKCRPAIGHIPAAL